MSLHDGLERVSLKVRQKCVLLQTSWAKRMWTFADKELEAHCWVSGDDFSIACPKALVVYCCRCLESKHGTCQYLRKKLSCTRSSGEQNILTLSVYASKTSTLKHLLKWRKWLWDCSIFKGDAKTSSPGSPPILETHPFLGKLIILWATNSTSLPSFFFFLIYTWKKKLY